MGQQNSQTTTEAGASPAALHGLAGLARQQAQLALQKIPVLGSVAWLMLQQASTRNELLAELERRVLPALMLGQTKLFMQGDAPVAFASWAWLSVEAADRFQRAPHQLAIGDWHSGPQPWLIDVLAPFGGAAEILDDLRATVFRGNALRQLVHVPTIPPEILTWPVMEASPAAEQGAVKRAGQPLTSTP